ncbi:MAG: hypothetical protein PF448_10115 [Bacteroidales bacterium]|jgi:porphobilinogen synthase|nr:hypothetical protein [Bacteroidales bacterium]
MPGNSQLSVDLLVEKAKKLYDKGIQALLLFGIPEHKDETGLVACQHNGIVQQAVRALKKEVPGMYLIADICNCEYTRISRVHKASNDSGFSIISLPVLASFH